MILPIRAYGDPALKKVAQDIEPGQPGLEPLVGIVEQHTLPHPRTVHRRTLTDTLGDAQKAVAVPA